MIVVEHLCVSIGSFSLRNVSFEVDAGQYAVLMGRTGCGKTTLLEAICGLRPVESGRIVLEGRDVVALKPAERGVGYVPQDAALFSTMTVRENLAFSLQVRKWPAADVRRRTDELGELLEIPHLLHRHPEGLSGGEAQRVALGRALAFDPRILLLDEPLSALDDATRSHMYDLLTRVHQHTGVTAIHITHSRSEAGRLADCILHLEEGSVHVAGNAERGEEELPTVAFSEKAR